MGESKSESLSLTYRIADNSLVLSQHLSAFVNKISVRICPARVLLNKSCVIAVGNKADVLTVVLVSVDKTELFGNFTCLLLCHIAERKERFCKLFLCERIQHIALVL